MSDTSNHFDADGHAHMVDVSGKRVTVREALASGSVQMSIATAELIRSGHSKKGDVLGIARLAAIQSTKLTSQLIPLCHAIPVESVSVTFEWSEVEGTQNPVALRCEVRVRTSAKTGVEMEAMTAASIGCLTIYDMVKSVERGIEIGPIRLLEKSGGKSGEFRRS
ncbi:MAG: cyclic pyranopterin monophosphate synthase MoaC [Rubripirellula sp.]